MLKKSLLLMAILGIAVIGAAWTEEGSAENGDDVEKAERFQESQDEAVDFEAPAPGAAEEFIEPQSFSSPVRDLDSLPALLGGESTSGLETLGFRPRPCWCCRMCCCW